MSQQITQRDRSPECRRNRKIQVGIHIAIQVELALLDELHDCRPGKQLGHRARSEQGCLRINGPAGFLIGEPIALLKKDPAILDHDNDCACDVRAL